MAPPPNLKKYRIGDFARYLGVSADFLKHYEENGLLLVQPSESGYRYYGFEQSGRILEYLRLRSYGVSVKEMQALLEKTPEEAVVELDEKIDKISAEIARQQSIVEEHQRFRAWFNEHSCKTSDWEITNTEPYYFLFHSHTSDFIKDEHIYEILNDWLAWLPITKSALYVRNSSGKPELFWGLAIPESLLKRYNLPVNDAVVKLTFNKTFVFHFRGVKDAFAMRSIAEGKHPAQETLRKLGFVERGDSLLINEMRLSDKEGQPLDGIGRFLIPIRIEE